MFLSIFLYKIINQYVTRQLKNYEIAKILKQIYNIYLSQVFSKVARKKFVRFSFK